jgi:hypothetical protein
MNDPLLEGVGSGPLVMGSIVGVSDGRWRELPAHQ